MPLEIFQSERAFPRAIARSLERILEGECPDPGGMTLGILAPEGMWIGARGQAGASALQPDDQFAIGSITKTFTAAAVMQLVDQKKMSIDDRVTDWLPWAPQEVTISHLLSHTSGLREFLSFADDQPTYFDNVAKLHKTPRSFLTPREVVNMSLSYGMRDVPGRSYKYVNANYLLAQLVAEKVCGEPLAQLISNNILQPLGLTHTYWANPNGRLPGLVANPAGDKFGGIFRHPKNYGGAGALVSTTGDVMKAIEGIFGGALLSQTSIASMTTPTRVSGAEKYGRGVEVWGPLEQRRWGHTGYAADMVSAAVYHPANRTTVVSLTNVEAEKVAVSAALTGLHRYDLWKKSRA